MKDFTRDVEQNTKEWIEKVVQVRRVTKVVKGGKKLSFRAIVIAGDGNGMVGVGVGKSSEVVGAIQKGISDAKKSLVFVPTVENSIPHKVLGKWGASRVLIKPASKGTGVIAGGAIRAIIEAAGIQDAVAKSIGSDSPLNNARAAIDGLKQLRKLETIAQIRGKNTTEELVKVLKV